MSSFLRRRGGCAVVVARRRARPPRRVAARAPWLRARTASRATSPTRTSRSRRRRAPATVPLDAAAQGSIRPTTLHLAVLRLHEGAHAATSRSAATLRPAVPQAWSVTRPGPARVHARALRPPAVPAEEQRRAVRDHGRDAARGWKRKLGPSPPRRPPCGDGTVYVTLLRASRAPRAGGSPRYDAVTAHRWSRKLAEPRESSPVVDAGRVYFGTEDGTVYALRARDGQVRWTLPGRAAPSRAALALATASSTSATTAARSTRSARRRRARSGGEEPSGAVFGLGGGQLLLHGRGRATGASTSATPTARVLVRGEQRRARLAHRHRRLRLRVARGRRGPGAAARRSTSAPTTAASTRSTRARASALDAQPGRQDLGRGEPSSATSSSSPTSGARHVGLGAARARRSGSGPRARSTR